MDTHVIDCILKQNNAFQPNFNAREAQESSSEINESLESDQEAYSVNVTKINTLSSSIDFSLQSSYNQTNRLDNQIQFEEFELDESLSNEISDIFTSNNSQISQKNKVKQASIAPAGGVILIEEQNQIIEDQYKDTQNTKQNSVQVNQKQFMKKSSIQDGVQEQDKEGIKVDPAIENIQLKKEIESLNFTLKQQEKENFYLHQNIKTLKEELYGQKLNAQKKPAYEDQNHFFQINSNPIKNQNSFNKANENSSLKNSAEKKQLNLQQKHDQEAASSTQINMLNEQMHVLRNEMSTMKEMYLAKLKEQTFLVETLTKKLGEKDEFIQKMKNSYINSLNQSKNSQLIQSQIYQNSANQQQQSSHLLQESCISELNKPMSIQQSIISQQHCLQQQQQGQLQQHFNNTFDQVKLSQEFEQLRRDIKFSTIGNISPFLRDEKVGGLREDLLSTTSNLQQGPNSSSNNSNYCNQSTNNYSKNQIQQQSPFNQSKYHNLSHISNLSNRGYSNEFNPNNSINGNIAQHNSSQIQQQNQGSSSNITVVNQTGMNCNNSTTTHMTSTSINSNNVNMNSNINNSHPGRNKGDLLNQKRNSSFTNSSANASNNLNQSLLHQTQNTNNQNANNSILQFTPVSNKHLNQSNSGSQQNNPTMASQNTQTQMQQTSKQQQITLDFRLTFNQNELFNAAQTQQQQFAILSSQDTQNTSNHHNIDPYIQDVEDSNQSHHFANRQTQLASQICSQQKQNPQLLQNNNPENQTNDQKPKANSNEVYIYNANYPKHIIEADNKSRDNNNLSNCSNNFPLSTKVQNTNNSLANKSLKEQLMNQQILQQKKQQILQNQQQQTYQNLIVKSNNQDLLKNLKKQSGTNQNQNQQHSQQNQSSPKKQQSRSYHISSNQNQNSSNSKAQQNCLQQQIQNAANPQIQYQEYIPKLNNNYNQMNSQNSTKNRKQNSTIVQGLNSCVSNLQDNTIPSSTMSQNSNFSNNLPIFRSINNDQQNHNSSCNSNQNGYNPNNNSFKFLNGKNNINNNITSQNNSSTTSNNVNQSQVEKKRFLQTTQISSSHNNQPASNKFSMIASPGKYSNSNSEQKQLFLRTQQIYPTSSSNNNNNNNTSSSQQRQKSLAIPSQLSVNHTNQSQQSSLKVPMSAGGARKNNSLSINSQNTCNNTNLIPTNFNATTAHSTTSSHSSAYQKGLQDLFKFNQNDKQKKLNDFFSKTLQVRPGELKSLNENLGSYSNSKNAAKLVQQMEFSSLDDVEIQLDDLQILSNQIKEVLQNDPLKKNTEERIQKGNQLNNGLRQSGGLNSQTQQQQQQLQNNNNNNRSQSENHNYQNLQQQFQLHQQLNNCLNSQIVNAQSQYTTNPNKKIPVKSHEYTQNIQNCPEDQQGQLQLNNYVASNTTNQRVRPPKNNNFIFNENNKSIPYPIAQNPSGASTTSSATQHSRNFSANNVNNNNNNSNLKNSNYKIHRKHLTLLNTDDISSKNQGNYAQSEISTQKAAFSDIHNFHNNNQNQYHQLY
ncbi:hypothetical protein TTHERM_00128890 (macronuclear) [Tetrahymena thermophila SB210]|uniref:Uncharacterized protein n=1 Tax=Tetrahymena thermophila (strain SB210) TaxID=312017 RepID=I7M7W3_TETTS|nr:hypothetical protein TTHERM_00128890 [Tetrahymena thermophila SB210]EAR96125.2 hypothetical protein TTHERM_00128890 [Tetrahymena thermophila SB210]|eukprot:XP_001016370.2 hypothetical protein TTHERM_00128890 [Tetrahymena thermophila SB210]